MSNPKLSEKLENKSPVPVIICMTHEDGNSLPAILQRLSQVWHEQARQSRGKADLSKLEKQASPCEDKKPIARLHDQKLAQKIAAHQQQALSQLEQSEQLKRLSRQILEDNKKMMSRNSYLKKPTD